jgi:uncharacterized membrane protein YfcA
VHLLSVALGFLIGLALGLLGGGGSILTVPVFVYVLGFGPKESIAMSLAVVGLTSLAGAAGHWRQGHVNIRVAMIFGPLAMAGSYLGTRLARHLTGAEQLTIFGTVMLVAAGFMFRGQRAQDSPHAVSLPVPLTAVEGFAVGTMTGLVGVGGGFLIVPSLVWAGLRMVEAVGTSLLAIAMNSAVGFYGYLGQVQIAWIPMALVMAGTLPGIAAGTYATRFVPPRILRRIFAVLILCVAIYILIRTS